MMKRLKIKLANKRDKIPKINFQSKDRVIVLAGQDKRSIGEIVKIGKGNEFVKVENTKLQTHYKKDDGVNTGGIFRQEGWIHISNIAHVTADGMPTKVRVEKGEKKKIFSRKTGEELRLNVAKAGKVQVEDKEIRKEKEELQKTKLEGNKKEKEAGIVEKKGKKKKGEKS